MAEDKDSAEIVMEGGSVIDGAQDIVSQVN